MEKINTIKIDDVPYRDETIIAVVKSYSWQQYSAVDYIIRSILEEDPNIKTDALITFNIRDFEDLCYSQGIEILIP